MSILNIVLILNNAGNILLLKITLSPLKQMACSQCYEKRRFASSSLLVRPSVPMEQLDSHWTDFREIYLKIFIKSVEKIQL
jgi:hypothetical protein